MMKAAFIHKTGGPESIEWGDLPIPAINPNEVLVKVSAVAVNLVDTYVRAGKYPLKAPLPLPYIIGSDMVGVVEKVGKSVTKFKVGQRVWTNSAGFQGRQGCFAEYAAIEQNLLYPAPAHVDDTSLVASLQAGATACLGLIHAAFLKATDVIFVNGGGGNVGSAVIQIAKARGATVFTSTSGTEKIEWCKSLGADLVVDYKKDHIEQCVRALSPAGVDVFWDTSRQPNFDLSVGLLAEKGRIVLMAGADARPPFPVGLFYRKQCSMKGIVLKDATERELEQCAELINACLEQKVLKSKIAKVMPLSLAAKAHSMLETKADLWGKIVLTV